MTMMPNQILRRMFRYLANSLLDSAFILLDFPFRREKLIALELANGHTSNLEKRGREQLPRRQVLQRMLKLLLEGPDHILAQD
jgi:hypothetical protein